LIVITVTEAAVTTVKGFAQNKRGNAAALKYLTELREGHLRHPYNRVMTIVKKAGEQGLLSDMVKDEKLAPLLTVNIETMDDETYKLIYS